MDSAEIIGLGQISLKMVGWSTGFADFDNDGLFDPWVVNGNTMEDSEDNTKLKPQRMQIFSQRSDKGFFEVGQEASSTLKNRVVGRGGAHADYDGDGRMDIAVLVHGGQPLLLHNTTTNDNNWVSLCLRQTGRNTRALGARAALDVAILCSLQRWGQMVHACRKARPTFTSVWAAARKSKRPSIGPMGRSIVTRYKPIRFMRLFSRLLIIE